MTASPRDPDTRRDIMRRAHRHYCRMNAAHPDWPFGSSLKIEQGKARSVPAMMARIRATIEQLVGNLE